jgi:hypothetical protein
MKRVERICTSRWILCVAAGLAVGLLAVGCSSTQGEGPEEPIGEPTGDPVDEGGEESGDTGRVDEFEDSGSVSENEEAAEAPMTGGTGRLRVKITTSGEAASAKLRILTSAVEPQVVEEGTSEQTFDLRAGRYDVEATLSTTLDHAQKRLQDVPIKAGETTERTIDYPVGTIVLQPMRGASKVRSKIRWRFQGGGDWFEQTSNTGEELTLSAGRYDAEIMVGKMAITINDIQVYEGKRTLSPQVTVSGGR